MSSRSVQLPAANASGRRPEGLGIQLQKREAVFIVRQIHFDRCMKRRVFRIVQHFCIEASRGEILKHIAFEKELYSDSNRIV